LLKQARAFGLGVMLATQNPVDLDYKGLSNCGTWFLGRLQTERDKLRVLDGLEGASAAAGAQFNRAEMERILSGLGNRVFLMNNVHDDAPVVFQSRWALSYLRGPLTQEQISTLMHAKKEVQQAAAASAAPSGSSLAEVDATSHPVLPPDIVELFLMRQAPLLGDAKLVYRPGLFGSARVHFENKSAGIDESRDVCLLISEVSEVSATVWDDGADQDQSPELATKPESGAKFAPLPGALSKVKTYNELSTALKEHLYRSQRIGQWKCKALKQLSVANESEGDFRVRLQQLVKEQRDLAVEKLRVKYAPKLAAAAESLRKAQQKLEKEKTQAKSETFNAALQFGTSILGAMFGRKLASASNLGKAATSMRAATRAAGQRQDVTLAEESIEAIQQKIDDLNADFEAESTKIRDAMPDDNLELEEIAVRPKKTDVVITNLALAWTPWIVTADGTTTPGWE